MATGKVVGQIQVTQGNIKVIGVDGVVREPGYEGYVYENEQVISNDSSALFQIKFLALPEASAYDGIFRILADGSVIHGRDAMDSMMSDENLVKVLETASVGDAKTAGEDIGDLETAAGEEGAEGSSSFTETDIVAESSVLGFNRGSNGALGFGITDFGSVTNYDAGQITPPAITSPNVVVYDENGTEPVIQVSATAEGAVTYGINGLDSDLFNIDSATGLVTFKESPDFENPRDSGGDNEYNTYVTATDSFGNYTTQLLSVSINNLNEAVTAFDDTVDAVEDTILSSTIDLDANDTDLDGNALSVGAGTYTTAQGGEIVIAADGSYTYTPPTNFNGVDSVNYTVTDGEFSDVGMLTINVAPANDAPVAVDDAVSAVEDTVLNSAIDLDANDYDVDEDALSVVAGTFATANGGQLVLSSDGTYTYTPAANFNG
ncbi:MAG: Ig-like domain-containing protein, partial [Sulfurimonas sp.]|nr:Ig-like domain-containing protein [Sulfurimonas sp.]